MSLQELQVMHARGAMKYALELLGKVTGWGSMIRPIIGYDEVRTFTGPDETEGTGRFVYLCATSICGESDAIKARGEGSTLVAALLDCAQKVVAYHEDAEKRHRKRREDAERAIVQAELAELSK